jgi:hypothetical protein
MRTYKTLLSLSAFALSFSCLLLSSCKKDEAPPAKPKLSMKEATRTVIESDGTIEVKIKLDKGAFEDVKVNYELSGTALDKVADPQNYDYEITSDYLSTKIVKGDSIGIIKIKLWSDLELEQTPETIIISIKDTDSNNIEVTRTDEIKITVNQEDGSIVLLEWPIPSATVQADMDILLRFGENISTWDGILTGSAYRSFDPRAPQQEFIFLPKVITLPAYGLSYVYYDGTLDPLDFTATFIDFINGALEPASQRQSFKPTIKYTAANKNKWTNATLSSTIVVQTFLKTSGGFSAPSSIETPPLGSRIGYSETILPAFQRPIDNLNWNKLKPIFPNQKR